MSSLLSPIFSPAIWPTFVFVAARIGGMMLIAPVWSTAQLPRTARGGAGADSGCFTYANTNP